MPAEASSIGTAVLPPRAAIAQLTLQLRAALQEADGAEAEDAAMDQDAALAQQRAELEELMQARCRELDEVLAQARAEAADAIAEANRQTSPQQVVPPINVVIDAEAFARVLATVLSESLPAWGPPGPAIGVGQLPAAPKPSLKHARHLDVFLIAVATLIVLVILAAWIG